MGNRHSGKPATLAEKFWRYVRKTRRCWLWAGTRQKPGYGRIGLSGRRVEYAHRVSWILHKGPIPDGLKVLHKCDNPSCVNPKHLFLGRDLENVQDMLSKGRGVAPPRYRYPVQKIVSIYRATGTPAAVAQRFGVSVRYVRNLRAGRIRRRLMEQVA